MIAGVHDLPLFIVAGLLLNITPGADMALIGARSASLGFRAGAAAALGVGAGCVVHVAAAALGLSALVASSATAFTLLRWAGAAYLVWLGIGLLRSRPANVAAAPATSAANSFARVFAQGFLTNALNPKVALFFLAFIPQFIAPGSPDKTLAFLGLGAVFVAISTPFLLVVVAVMLRLRRLPASPRVSRALHAAGGTLFAVLAVRLATARSG